MGVPERGGARRDGGGDQEENGAYGLRTSVQIGIFPPPVYAATERVRANAALRIR
jgi:hypothetical protein